jgi:hypothetical protein
MADWAREGTDADLESATPGVSFERRLPYACGSHGHPHRLTSTSTSYLRQALGDFQSNL